MPFWMQTEDPEYYDNPEQPSEDDGDSEWEDVDNVLIDDVPYYGA